MYFWNNYRLSDDHIQSYCLLDIQKLLSRYGKSLTDFEGMLLPDSELLVKLDNRLIREEYDYNIISLEKEHEESLKLLNMDQRIIYDIVISAVENKLGGLFFVYGQGHGKIESQQNDCISCCFIRYVNLILKLSHNMPSSALLVIS